MKNYLVLLSLLIVRGAFAQIWEYEPRPYGMPPSPRTDSVATITSWSHDIRKGKDTGIKTLTKTEQYDPEGNLVSETFEDGSTVYYKSFDRGYWTVKIMDEQQIHHEVEFDSAGNLVRVVI